MTKLFDQWRHILWDGAEKLPIILSFGAGVDSTAILVEFWKRDIRPDHIVFADTGGERPDIYSHIKRVDAWLKKVDFPPVTVVRKRMKDGSIGNLEEECIRQKTLPSLAFGRKKCSLKFKIGPIDAHLKKLKLGRCVRVIGYGTGELDRALSGLESASKRIAETIAKSRKKKGNEEFYWFPLIDWKMDREACKKSSSAIGFCTAKSSCFFCPGMRPKEIIKLRDEYPELMKRALAIENGFKPRSTTIGLGREWTWQGVLDAHDSQPQFDFGDWKAPAMGCGCTDI